MTTQDTRETIVATLQPSLHRFVMRRVRDRHAAQDIIQEVVLKVLARAAGGELPPAEKLVPWTLAIARNAVVDHYRKRQTVQLPADHAEPAAPSRNDVDAADAVRAVSSCMHTMVAQLPAPYGEALRLADLEGLEQAALARRTGLSISGAKSRVQRSRHMLRGLILDCCHVETDTRGRVIDTRRTERSAKYCGSKQATTQSAPCSKYPASLAA